MSVAAAPAVGAGAGPGLTARRLRRFLRNPLGVGSAVLLAVIALSALFAPLLAPYDPGAIDLSAVLLPPSPEHLLGTDESGRDTLARCIY